MIVQAARERGSTSPARGWSATSSTTSRPAAAPGCRTVLIDNGNETEWVVSPGRLPHHTAIDLAEAARRIVAADGPDLAADAAP